MDLFAVSTENTARIKRQNDKTISVILGNPPYNDHQENFNHRNANRPYKGIDTAIKNSYIKEGTAQNQIVVYDMYTRFFRWAIDRSLLLKLLMVFVNVSIKSLITFTLWIRNQM